MNELFNNDMRVLSDRELIYEVTNRESALSEELTLKEIIESLTPGRKRVAMAVIELYKRSKEKECEQILSSHDIFSLMECHVADLPIEEVWCIFLNQANRVIKKARLFIGGQTQAAVDVRIITKQAIMCGALGVIMVHNHPSGNTQPSKQDDQMTERLRKGLELLDIKLIDHLIIADGKYYSYSDEGQI